MINNIFHAVRESKTYRQPTPVSVIERDRTLRHLRSLAMGLADEVRDYGLSIPGARERYLTEVIRRSIKPRSVDADLALGMLATEIMRAQRS